LINKVFVLVGALFLGQGLSFIAAPILARYYSPELFGAYGLITSLVVLCSGFTTLKFEQAIIVAEPLDRNDLMSSVTLLNIILTFLVALPLSLVLSFYLNVDIYYLLIGIFLYSYYLIFRSYYLAIDKVKLISKVDITKSIVLNSCQILFFMFFAYQAGLIYGYLISLAISVACYLCFSKVNIRKLNWPLLNKYNKFPKYTFPEYIINTASQQLPIYSLAIYYNKYEVGLYVLADKIVRIPIQLISKSILQVLSRESAENKDTNLLLKPTIVLLLFSTCIFTPLAIYSELIVSIYLGEDWIEVGPILSALSFWMWIKFYNSPSSAYLIANGYQKFMLKVESLSFVARLFVVGFLPMFYSFNQVIWAFSIVGVIINLLIILYAFYCYYRAKDRNIFN
jgi:O-antigen/teichoic acid export membrane protein